MDCPACHAELRRCLYHATVVDVCDKCHGLLLAANELKAFIDRWIDAHPDMPDAKPTVFRKIVHADSAADASRSCPRCRLTMAKFNYAYDSNVLLDRCGKCDGMWMDGGEIRRIAAYHKGDPRTERLAVSIAESTKAHFEFLDSCKQVERLARRIPLLFVFPMFVLPTLVLPLRDDLDRKRFPCVTVGLLIANLLCFLGTFLWAASPAGVFGAYGVVPRVIMSGEAYYSFVTYMFVHAGILHLVGNMLFLWIFGDNVEDALGHITYALVFLACGVTAALAHVFAFSGSGVPCVGASGAVAGAMGAYFALYPQARVNTFFYFRVFRVPAWLYIAFWFVMQVVFARIFSGHAAVAYLAHIGGFLLGLIVGITWRATVGHPTPDTA
ncbi:MAG: rhomboid family intramembrane serine protease [bacterium]|nr:rhomboid family intramembrane serine protease [bacterium]